MIFNNTANGLFCRQKYEPVNGNYKFRVTEIYEDLSPTFTVEVPEKNVKFVEQGKGFILKVKDETFSPLIRKGEQSGCTEMFIYPLFS